MAQTIKERPSYTHLGAYMRKIARQLDASEPLDADRARNGTDIVYGYGIDTPYVEATLMRLAQRGVARKVEGGYVKGPNWAAARKYYGWV